MADDQPYSKREIDAYFKVQDTNFVRLFDEIHTQNDTLKRIEENQANTATDVVLIKDTIKDYGDYKKTVDGLVNYKWWIIGGLAAFSLLGSSVILLFESKLRSDNNAQIANQVRVEVVSQLAQQLPEEISKDVNDAFNMRFSKIQINNN